MRKLNSATMAWERGVQRIALAREAGFEDTDAMTGPTETAPVEPERRPSLGATLRAVLFTPREWFSRLSGHTAGRAVRLAILVHVVADPLALLGMHLLEPVHAPTALAMLIAAPISTPIGICFTAAMVHGLARLTSRERPHFSLVVETLAYAQLPFLVAIVPVAGPVVALAWWLWLSALGLRSALRRSWLFGWAGTVVGPAVGMTMALGLRTFCVEAFKMPSPSMAPTLLVGDHFFVRKNAYGWFEHRLPERGDVVVFRAPERSEQDLVKRVMGLPGDTIVLQAGAVFINGWRIATCVAGAATVKVAGEERSGFVVVEMIGDRAYLVFHDEAALRQREHGHEHGDEHEPIDEHQHGKGNVQGPYVVQENEIFVLGDNRENSDDSRGWFEGRGGGVRVDHIKGRANMIWMSFAEGGRADWSRIGTSLTSAPKCPTSFPPAICSAVERCLTSPPAPETTTPPSPKR